MNRSFSATSPELILHNGCIVTHDPLTPRAQALAAAQGYIIAVGSDQDVLHLAAPGTRKINLDGRLVVPGFIDSHIHFYEWALRRQDMQLDGMNCLADLLAGVSEAAERRKPGTWLMGQGWNETDWQEPVMPSRESLDHVAPAHPVLLWRCDLHLAAANSAALERAGIDHTTPDPPDGRIERDKNGVPTGILRELAINLVRQAVAPPSEKEVHPAFKEAAGALHRRGITAIHDIRLMADEDGDRALQAFQKLDQDSRLDLRSWVSIPGHRLDEVISLGLMTGFGNDRVRLGHVKFFSDGGMGARTAWMIEPYLDAASGMPLTDMTDLARSITRADNAGLSVMVHAVGDRANRELLDIFEALESPRRRVALPGPYIQHRIEHVQMIRPEDRERLKRLNLALCVTPMNMILDINLIDKAVGDKGRWTYSFRQLIDTGAPVMFSSDCPVCDPDPLMAIHAATTRQRLDGTPKGGWYPESRVSVEEALKAYTLTPAKVHRAHDLGVILPGARADLVVLSENFLDQPRTAIPRVTVDLTLFDGRIVHRQF